MKRELLTFITVCYGLSIVSAGLFRLSGTEYASLAGTLFATGYMLLPLASVLITQLLCGEKLLSGCGASFRFNKWWIAAWLAMPLLVAAAIAVSALMPGVEFSFDTEVMKTVTGALEGKGIPIGPWYFLGITLISGLFAGATLNAVLAFGEEAAWRGYLSRIMESLGFWRKSLVIGAVWGIWHTPLILMGHNYPTHPVTGVFMMIALCTLLSPVLMFLKERSGSVIAASIAHGTMNATAGASVMVLTGYNEFLCGVGGLAGIIVIAAINAVIFLACRRLKTIPE